MIKIFLILHVLSISTLFGTCIGAFVLPTPENRKKMLLYSGIASLGAFITGFGMAGMNHIGFPGWLLVKIACWLLLSVMVGMFFREPNKRASMIKLSTFVFVTALVMVFVRPF